MTNTVDLMLEIEALIFASNQPLTAASIQQLISNAYEEAVEMQLIQDALEAIIEKYNEAHYPFEVKMIGGGYQFLTRTQYHALVAQMNGDKYNKKLSATAMETLAIIAYRQPITKTEIEHIRGVSSDYAIHKLLEKELITISGRDENAVGKPLLYATSGDFFDYLGINDTSGLPELKELNTELLVVPTAATEAIPNDIHMIDIDLSGDAGISHITVQDDGHLSEEI